MSLEHADVPEPSRRGVTVNRPALRVATPADEATLDALMKQSAAALFPRFYDEATSPSAVLYVAQIDPMLLEDGTYYVLEAGGEAVACGGWSRRDRLYTGSGDAAGDARELDPATEPARVRAMFVRDDWTRRGLGRRILEECETAAGREGFRTMSLMATLPGVPLYLAYGFRPLEETEVVLPDGVALPCVSMEKELSGTSYRGL
jgi:GNAT superfamily N-acetyltransferase